MVSRFETFSEGEVCAINEEVVHSNTKMPRRRLNFGLSVFTGGKKIIFILNLQKNRKMHLRKSSKCL